MIHELKIYPQYYARVADGTKTFEIRNADRGFQFGDEVILREWDPTEKHDPEAYFPRMPGPKGYTGSKDLKFKIGYVLPIDAERVIFSLLKEEV